MGLSKADARELAEFTWTAKFRYEKLRDFIYGLDKKKFRLSTSQFIAAEKLLIKLAESGEIHNSERVCSYLAPLFSFSPQEQAAFYDAYKLWHQRFQAEQSKRLTNIIRNKEAIEFGETIIGEPDSPPPPPNPEIQKTRLERISAYLRLQLKKPQNILILIFVLAAATGIFYLIQTSPEIRDFLNPPPPSPTPIMTFELTPTPTPVEDRKFEPLPVGNLYFWWIVAALGLIFAFYGGWQSWWLLRKCQINNWRETNKEHLKFKRPCANKEGNELYEAASYRRFAQELRLHRRVPVNSLDAEATVLASADQAGFFTPIYGVRRVTPEYLVLIDRAGYLDQQAQLIDEWIRVALLLSCRKEMA